MLRHAKIGRICCGGLAFALLLTLGFMGAAAVGLIQPASAAAYETRLFDTSAVHTIDIVMDDWDAFIDTCENEEYAACTLVIDGEKLSNVAIRAKGNTSLSSVAQYGNDRYSFKVEFDHYDDAMTYHGLDKLSLNNLIQDATFMKDYVSYTLMRKMGVAAPLCSYVQVNVNGSPWGLYLAVEGVEEAFIKRNYGNDGGEMYKPDSMSFGGGRGNGRDFSMDDFTAEFQDMAQNMPDMSQMMGSEMPEMGGEIPGMGGEMPDMGGRGGFGGGMGGFGMGSSDVKLQYIDDDPASYSNIFDNAVTNASDADKARLIASLKALSEGDVSVVDVDQAIRYFAVHDFLRNDDSYTGSMIHNYYLYEENGVLSMVPWDYNLAFGGFAGGNASSQINSDIMAPVSGDMSDRPMIAWIFESEEYTAQYRQVYAELVETITAEDWLNAEIARVAELIAPYVEADANAFYSYEEFGAGTQTLESFVTLRAQAAAEQLNGSDEPVPTDDIDLSDMGSMGMGGGFGGGGFGGDFDLSAMPEGMGMPEGMEMPEGFEMPEGMEMPEGFEMPESMELPEGLELPPGMADMPSATAEPSDATDEMVTAEPSDAPAEPAARTERQPTADMFTPGAASQPDNSSQYILLIASGIILVLGIVLAAVFKGRN